MTTLQREATVLIVDDNLDSAASLAMLVMLEGYNAATATNGLQALEYLRRHEPPRFIILDMMMPVMDGWQFVRECRGLGVCADTPVIILSAARSVQQVAADPGVQAVVSKPFDLDRLLDLVAEHAA